MTKLQRTQRKAEALALARGHDLGRWRTARRQDGRPTVRMADCKQCSAFGIADVYSVNGRYARGTATYLRCQS